MKKGRPGIQYEQFVEVWAQLLNEGRASNRNVCDQLGGSQSTIAIYRERYEREKSTCESDVLKQIELPDTIVRAIAAIKVKEIQILEKNYQKIEARIDEYLKTLKDTETKNTELLTTIDELKTNFDAEKLELEKKLAASQARMDDFLQREQKYQDRYDTINQQYNQAKQAAAVAEKEIELLQREKSK